ncbi:MAG TPA: hypothetical protein VGX68_10075 [Thermoanaerobaculia bacterium]|jgi:hypothetical protein|nr:hypothetical protein [Thermoanaerobaculia bacterium]
MGSKLSVEDVMANLEARAAFHREQEAHHRDQEAFHARSIVVESRVVGPAPGRVSAGG